MIAPLSEKQFMQMVIQAMRKQGFEVYHTFDARRSAPGFPDIVAVHPQRGGVIFAELKTETGRLSRAQIHWLDTLREAGARAYLWRPSDWDDIVAVLNGEKETPT